MYLRIRGESDYRGYLVRLFAGQWSEIAYIKLGLSGPQAEIEFPSDWSEHKAGWVRLGFGLFKLCFMFPWPWMSKDDGQCSGHTYGFNFFGTGLHLHWGKQRGKRNDPFTVIDMPWQWRHKEHKILSEPETHPYKYVLRNGEVQDREATIKKESRLWWRPWLPFRRLEYSIDVAFDKEVGERSGTWKGGVFGCGYTMQPGETPRDTLRRMEAERKL